MYLGGNMELSEIARIMFKSMSLEQLLNVDHDGVDKDSLIILIKEIKKKQEIQVHYINSKIDSIHTSINIVENS